MKKIAFLINKIAVGGGAERVFVDDANMFARNRYDVVIFALYDDLDAQALRHDLEKGVELHLVRARGPFDMKAAFSIARIMRERGIRHLVSTSRDFAALVDPRLALHEGNAQELADSLQTILKLSAHERGAIRTQSISAIESHSLSILVERLMEEMQK